MISESQVFRLVAAGILIRLHGSFKGSVHKTQDGRDRAEVCSQLQALERERLQPVCFYDPKVRLDVRVAKAIDGLLRISDDK